MKMLLAGMLALVASASLAQTLTVNSAQPGGGGSFSGGSDGTFQSNLDVGYTVSGSAYSFNLRGDVTAQFSGTATNFGFQGVGNFSLTTGPAPVQLTDIVVAYNGKEVVSGGSMARYEARNYYAGIFYTGNFGADFIHEAYPPGRNTQGIWIEDVSTNLPGTILAANTDYTLSLIVYPFVSNVAYTLGSSMLGYTLEFGGDVAPWLDGLTVSFVANPVPEPASLLMLGVGAALLLARRRRQG